MSDAAFSRAYEGCEHCGDSLCRDVDCGREDDDMDDAVQFLVDAGLLTSRMMTSDGSDLDALAAEGVRLLESADERAEGGRAKLLALMLLSARSGGIRHALTDSLKSALGKVA